jgi:hypothetical protein
MAEPATVKIGDGLLQLPQGRAEHGGPRIRRRGQTELWLKVCVKLLDYMEVCRIKEGF